MSAPAINAFLRIRRAIRSDSETMEELRAEIKYLRHHAGMLARASPFNESRAATLSDEADLLQADYDHVQTERRHLGVALLAGAWEVDEVTTFEQRCEILNINEADRKDLPPDCGLLNMFWAYGLEDSAERRRMPWKSGPLYCAVQSEMDRVMLHTEAGRAAMAQLWKKQAETGGLFENLPVYDQQPDGTIKRRPPDLRVLDTNDNHYDQENNNE